MRPGFVTFDCYGTLIDWNRGIRDAFTTGGERQGRTAVGGEILAAYHRAEPRLQAGGYRSYRRVLTELEALVADELGWEEPEQRGWLAESLPSWPPFDDANPALERLAEAGFRLGILSNIDDDLLAATRRHFTVEFDLLVTAEAVHSYKPAPAHFERALKAVDGDPSRLLHVAQSWFHDVQPAVPLGIPTVWVNRWGETMPATGPRPNVEVAGLGAAVDWIEDEFA